MSGVSDSVRAHYEKFPYPIYPWYARARWNQLDAIDVCSWGIHHEPRTIWVAGAGAVAPLMFGRRNFDSRVIASDLSAASLKTARWRLRLWGVRNVEFRQEDLLETNYMDRFDAVDAYGVIHHLESPLAGLQKIFASLRYGGVARIMIYSESSRHAVEEIRKGLLDGSPFPKSMADLKSYLDKKHCALPQIQSMIGTDADNDSGLADAFLHPQVHIFSDESAMELMKAGGPWRKIEKRAHAHHLFFLKK